MLNRLALEVISRELHKLIVETNHTSSDVNDTKLNLCMIPLNACSRCSDLISL